jgi:hypothetical protein
MSNQKLSSLAKSGSNRPFNPQGFVDAKGQFVPLVKPRGARHAIGVGTIGMIEDQLYDLGIDADVIAAVEIIAAAWEAVALEPTIRAEAEAEAVKAKAEAAKAEAEAEAVKAKAEADKAVRRGGLSSFAK